MIQNYDEYKRFVLDIFAKIPVLYVKQVTLALQNTYKNIDNNKALMILFIMQKDNYILISKAGIVMTTTWYRFATGDEFGDGLDKFDKYKCYLGNEIQIYGEKEDKTTGVINTVSINDFIFKTPDFKYLKDQIQCMWYIVDCMPASINFSFNCVYPWTVMFEKEADTLSEPVLVVDPETFEIKETASEQINKIVTIARVKSKSEAAMREAFRLLPPIKDKKQRAGIERVAVMDKPDHAFNIPRVGFSKVLCLSKKEPFYTVVEERNGDDAWADTAE